MKRALKEIALVIFAVGVIVAGLYQLGTLLNVSKLDEANHDIREIIAKVGESISFSAGSLRGCNTSQMYLLADDTYCGAENWQLTRRVQFRDWSTPLPDGENGNRQQEIKYEFDHSGQMTQSLAYARALLGNISGDKNKQAIIQNLVWASSQWNGYDDSVFIHNPGPGTMISASRYDPNNEDDDTMYRNYADDNPIYCRSYQFANFIYFALNSEQKLGLHYTPTQNNSEDLNVLVDQANCTYTVGPYTVSFDNQSNTGINGWNNSMATLVRQEILGANLGENEENQFCTGKITTNIIYDNGTTRENVSVDILDENGRIINPNDKGIVFPEFGKEFYIRYKASIDEDLIKKIEPSIQINYAKKIVGSFWTYHSSEITYNMYQDNGGFLRQVARENLNLVKVRDVHTGDSEWIFRAASPTRLSDRGGQLILNTDVANWAETIKNQLKEQIKSEGAEWGVDIKTLELHMVAGIWWNNNFYSMQTIGDPGAVEMPYYSRHEYTEDRWRCAEGDFGWTTNYAEVSRHCSQYGNGHNIESNEFVGYYGSVISGPPGMGDSYNTGYYENREDARNNFREHFEGITMYLAIQINAPLKITETIENIQPNVQLEVPPWTTTTWRRIEITEEINGYGYKVEGGGAAERVTLPSPPSITIPPPFEMYMGGNVFQALPSDKLYAYGNSRKNGDLDFGGIQVQLVDVTPRSQDYLKIKATTTTDSQGEYGFRKLHPLHKYKVIFTYNGMQYEDIDYTNNLSGNYSTASEDNRATFNNYFAEISTSPQNYYKDGEWRKAYGMYTKIENANGDYIRYNQNTNVEENSGSFRYYDALQIFKELTTNGHDFNETNTTTMNNTYYSAKDNINQGYSAYESAFKGRLRNVGVSTQEQNNIWQFMMDTIISASTTAYPEQNRFVLKDIDDLRNDETYILGYPYLYIKPRDQSRQVDFGLRLRDVADVDLLKDLYKATIIVNTKQQEYKYNKKQLIDGIWEVNLDTGAYEFTGGSVADNRASNAGYIGEQYGGSTYSREIRKSDYLYDGSDAGTSDYKNMQVFVTYKIRVVNLSQVIHVNIPEIVDYYDSDQFEFNRGYKIINDNTYLGDSRGNKIGDVSVSTNSVYRGHYGNSMDYYYSNSSNINGLYNYSSLYITGIKSSNPDSYQNADILRNGEDTYVYITFKVNNDPVTGKVKLDQEINGLLSGNTEGIDKIGKRNIAEINGYKTYYRNVVNNRGVYSTAGVIDQNSNPGSLKAKDMNSNGDIISSTNSWENRLENDCDKANNLKLKIDTDDDDDTRTFSGYTFEDARTQISNNAVIGNGVFNESDRDTQGNSDKKINGITVQLVELIPECDSQGFTTGRYIGEKVWSSINYDYNGSGFSGTSDNTRYYSGTNSSKVILSGPGVFAVTQSSLQLNQGEYKFESLPPGDFMVRFIYGDTSQTILTNQSNEVNDLLGNVGPDGLRGLNSISYTGQDYKSTIYQNGIDQNASDVYNGVRQFVDTNNQNYYNNREVISNSVPSKSAMYYYDIAKSQGAQNVSDAKDIYSYRNREMDYSKGSNVNSSPNGAQTLKNHRAEVLESSTELLLKAEDAISKGNTNLAQTYQNQAISELMTNTTMVAQTGVINTEVEYNRQITEVGADNLNYHVKDLDLGLTERPEAQLALSKELTNIQIRLANGQILFDTTQSTDNLSYGSHYTHTNVYENESRNGLLAYRLRKDIATEQKARNEELVTAYMDEELMSGATVRLTYKLAVDNIGEVDYIDKQFYYLGTTNNTDINNVSRTNANRVIDYVTNEMNYTADYQEDINNWTVVTANLLFGGNSADNDEDNDLVNTIYEQNLNTFNVLVTTNKLSDELIPRAIDNTGDFRLSRKEVSLILSTLLTNTVQNDNLVYTNLAEILETTNTVGRRMQLSKAGNQVMPYQSEEDRSIDDSTTWITPAEIDSDSGQKVQVSVPTGENRAYNRMIVIAICALALLGLSIFIIKNKLYQKKP